MNISCFFAVSSMMAKAFGKVFDNFPQHPLSNSKGYWGKLSKQKRTASRSPACGPFLECPSRGAYICSRLQSTQRQYANTIFLSLIFLLCAYISHADPLYGSWLSPQDDHINNQSVQSILSSISDVETLSCLHLGQSNCHALCCHFAVFFHHRTKLKREITRNRTANTIFNVPLTAGEPLSRKSGRFAMA